MTKIVLAFMKNDRAAFEQIYESYFSFVYRVVNRMVRNTEQAEDLVQDIFVKIYQNRKKYSAEYAFSTWIHQIAVNHTLNFLKREKFFNVTIFNYLTNFYKQSEPFSDRVEQSEAKQEMQELLLKLSPDYRVCLILCDLEEMTYEEIAETLKLNLNTVKTRIHRARLKLASLFIKEKGGLQYVKKEFACV